MKSILLVLAVVATTSSARADQIVGGTVVRIEASEIYVNLGVSSGVANGAPIRIKHPIALKHPVTRAPISDWVPIGSATVTQAGAVLCRAVVGDLIGAVKVGDIAEVLVHRDPAPVKPPQPQQPLQPQQQPTDPETAEVLRIFATQSSQSVDARIANWEGYLSTHGASPYAAAIREELETLHRLREELTPRPVARPGDEDRVDVEHDAPKSAVKNTPIPIVVVLPDRSNVASAFLHYRTRGERSYRSVLLSREHEIYLRGAIPALAVVAPGVEYFVEASKPSGQSMIALATATTPIAVDVAESTVLDDFAPIPGRSSVRLAADLLDFRGLDSRDGDRTDRMFTATVDFTYRLASIVEAIGVGYGAYAGAGGYADLVWSDAMPAPQSAFHYGYADVEIGGDADGTHISGAGRLIAGVGKSGFGMGFEGRLRLGSIDRANLQLIGRTIDQVGWLSEIRFGARPIDKLGVGISVGATDQPNKGDVGVKLGTDFEIRATDWVAIILRGSWQGRTTTHGGIGGGAGLDFYW